MILRLLGFFFFSSALAAASQDVRIRAAIDIGMGGPKLRVAEVDLKTNMLVKLLHEELYFVNFYDSVLENEDQNLSSDAMRRGFQAIEEALGRAKSLNAEEIVMIAASAFRIAANGAQFAAEIQERTGIFVHIIDQTLEGKLAFLGASSKMGIDPDCLVIWDVGGGNMQFVSKVPDGTYLFSGSDTGSGAFKDWIVEKLQCRNRSSSPNPMSAEEINQAQTHARSLSYWVDLSMREKIGRPETTLVGVGSVFARGIRKKLGDKDRFWIEDLEKFVLALAGKNDEDLGGGDFAPWEGSNAILVLGIMQNLNLQKLEIANINNADGALIYKPFWEK